MLIRSNNSITGFQPFELPISDLLLEVITLAVVLTGITLAWRQYASRPVPQQPPQQVSVFTTAARNSLYDDAFNEVHRSNMAKLVDGKVIRRDDGKVLKPEGWQPPQLAQFLPDES